MLLRNVKGILFLDYIRMIGSHKSVDWRSQLDVDDMHYLNAQIDPAGWYPMASFERLGNAILANIAQGDVQAARIWGRMSVDRLKEEYPSLVSPFDPVETLTRFWALSRRSEGAFSPARSVPFPICSITLSATWL